MSRKASLPSDSSSIVNLMVGVATQSEVFLECQELTLVVSRVMSITSMWNIHLFATIHHIFLFVISMTICGPRWNG